MNKNFNPVEAWNYAMRNSFKEPLTLNKILWRMRKRDERRNNNSQTKSKEDLCSSTY